MNADEDVGADECRCRCRCRYMDVVTDMNANVDLGGGTIHCCHAIAQ